MLLRHYQLLLQHKRFCHLLLRGVCIADRQTETREMLLFQIKDAYVEVTFDRSLDKIISSKCFMDLDELEPYLSAIDIDEIMA